MLSEHLRSQIGNSAIEKLDWYLLRWGIEVFHPALKSGCKIPQRQLGSAKRFEACLAIDMVVAWRIFHFTKLGREMPNIPCTCLFRRTRMESTPHAPDENACSSRSATDAA